MNYVSVVYGVIFALMMSYWWIRGKRTFRSRDEREDVAKHAIEAVKHSKTL